MSGLIFMGRVVFCSLGDLGRVVFWNWDDLGRVVLGRLLYGPSCPGPTCLLAELSWTRLNSITVYKIDEENREKQYILVCQRQRIGLSWHFNAIKLSFISSLVQLGATDKWILDQILEMPEAGSPALPKERRDEEEIMANKRSRRTVLELSIEKAALSHTYTFDGRWFQKSNLRYL